MTIYGFLSGIFYSLVPSWQIGLGNLFLLLLKFNIDVTYLNYEVEKVPWAPVLRTIFRMSVPVRLARMTLSMFLTQLSRYHQLVIPGTPVIFQCHVHLFLGHLSHVQHLSKEPKLRRFPSSQCKVLLSYDLLMTSLIWKGLLEQSLRPSDGSLIFSCGSRPFSRATAALAGSLTL